MLEKGNKMSSKFDWDKLAQNLNDNALSDGNKKTYAVDERFYKLSKDENGNGGALIRFIPDADDVPFVKMTQINAQQGKGKPFISEWSPQTIGLPDPINERFSQLWSAGEKEKAKNYGRKFRYLTNIKVIKDPNNPANEGKIFLFDMSPTLFEKIKNAAAPSESEIALGGEAKEVFNPVSGNSFLLKVKNGTTGMPSFEDSKFADRVDGIYKSDAEAEKDIKTNSHSLSEFLKPESFLSYEELKRKLDWFDGITEETEVPTTSATTEAPKAEEKVVSKPAADMNDDELDAALADLLD